MPAIPRDHHFDSSLAMRRDPYRFIEAQCRRHNADLFETRLLLQKTICMTGRKASELFHDNTRMMRSGAAPAMLRKTLLGQYGVQTLDNEDHRHRKAMFMGLMTPERIDDMVRQARVEWQRFTAKWMTMKEVVLYDELHELLMRAVCEWAGVPLEEREVAERTRDVALLFDAAGAAGPRHMFSRNARKKAEAWAADVITRVRNGELKPAPHTAAHVIAHHRELDGKELSPRVAAIELLNVIRPTVAVSVYITFVAHALHLHPEYREQAQRNELHCEHFAQEVRRFYPFFPAIIALTREEFEWNGYTFPAATRVVLDIYGTNHDPREWSEPDEFRPERFQQWDGCPYNLIPQGGGEHHIHHRCPGEFITIALMRDAIDQFAHRMKYDVPEQDLEINFQRLPALPHSRFIISNVRRNGH